MELFDAHTHLNSDQLYPDRKQHLDDFVSAGGKGLVNIGVNHERNLRALDIAKNHTTSCKIGATIGIHPGETTWGDIGSQEDITNQFKKLEILYEQNKEYIRAIGEIGIDAHFDRDDRIKDLQVELFRKQCEFARKINLPIVIHSRDHFDLTLEILTDYVDLKIYLHCRGYTAQNIRIIKEKIPNLWIGFCGNITYPKATEIRESFQACLDLQVQILLETDAPYLSPQAVRGTQNNPSQINHLYEWVIKNYGSEIPNAQGENFSTLYDLKM